SEAEARWGQVLTFSAGVRHDAPDGYDAETTARAMLGLELFGPAWRPYVSWSESFKLPSLFALGNPLVGNPDLRPERAESIEFGFAVAPAALPATLRLAAFTTRYRDLVDFDPARFINVNRDRVKTHGGEVEVGWQAGATARVTAAYTYTRFDIEPGGGQLRRRPRHKGVVNAEFALDDDWRAVATVIVVGAATDASIATGQVRLAGYELLNLATTRRLAAAWELGLALRNLLDQRFEETVGVPDPGLSFRADLRYSF
ncbi:MAG: TonB-dependent receptor, partial [Gammaproteobacteria bacterium]